MKETKNKLIIINQMSGYLFVDIANFAASVYDEVVLLTGSLHPLNTPLNKKVKVVSIKNYNRKNLKSRFISWVIGFAQIIYFLKFRFANYKILASSNPPLNTWLPLFVGKRTSLMVLDLYPEALSDTGMISKRNVIYKLWSRLNRNAYQKFFSIITLTEGMKEAVMAYRKHDLHVVSAWHDDFSSVERNRLRENIFIKKFNLQNKFIVLYSGNLGREYEVEGLIDVANYLKKFQEIKLVIVGKGWKFDILKKLLEQQELTNILLLPYQPPAYFNASLSAMDIGIVAQATTAPKVCIPSKTFNILAFGKPLLCLGSSETDLSSMIAKNRLGGVFASNDVTGIGDFILSLYKDKTLYHQYSEAAKSISAKFTKENAKTIINLT